MRKPPYHDGGMPAASQMALAAVRAASGGIVLGALLLALHVEISDPTEGAVLRIALRTTAGTAQVCRRIAEEEMEKLPVHMRRTEICETHAVPYRLEVRAGDTTLLDRTYEASGLRGDRPLTVNENLGLAAGRHDVSIRFTPVVADGLAARDFLYAGSIEFPDGRIRVASVNEATGTFEIR